MSSLKLAPPAENTNNLMGGEINIIFNTFSY